MRRCQKLEVHPDFPADFAVQAFMEVKIRNIEVVSKATRAAKEASASSKGAAAPDASSARELANHLVPPKHANTLKLLVDAAHCGDSGLSMAENEALIAKLGAAHELGIFHASSKTTRGCLSTDDGWIGAMLAAAARTGELKHVFVEVFHHEDPALEPLRKMDPGHGIDTRDGRSYTEVTTEALRAVGHRLNNLVARGILKA